MFPARYFAPRYFAPHYFAKVGETLLTIGFDHAYFIRRGDFRLLTVYPDYRMAVRYPDYRMVIDE